MQESGFGKRRGVQFNVLPTYSLEENREGRRNKIVSVSWRTNEIGANISAINAAKAGSSIATRNSQAT
jgi:hypothetical protein